MANRRQGQSRCLTKKEIQDVIQFQKNSRHSIRNICLVNMSVFLGCRVGEISSLLLNQVVNTDWTIKDEVVLLKENTKSKKNRVMYLVHKDLRTSLENYINHRRDTEKLEPTKKCFEKSLFENLHYGKIIIRIKHIEIILTGTKQYLIYTLICIY